MFWSSTTTCCSVHRIFFGGFFCCPIYNVAFALGEEYGWRRYSQPLPSQKDIPKRAFNVIGTTGGYGIYRALCVVINIQGYHYWMVSYSYALHILPFHLPLASRM